MRLYWTSSELRGHLDFDVQILNFAIIRILFFKVSLASLEVPKWELAKSALEQGNTCRLAHQIVDSNYRDTLEKRCLGPR